MLREALKECSMLQLENECLLAKLSALQPGRPITHHLQKPNTPESRALMQLYRRRYRENQRQLKEAEELLGSVPEGIVREMLRLHYLEGLTWEKVADRMNYSTASVFRLAKLAEEQLDNDQGTKRKGVVNHDRKGKKN